MMTANMAAGHISILFGLRGPNFGTISACASGAHAIGEAFETIRRGAARIMLAGGAEAPIVPIAIATFNSMKALSTRNDDPAAASRPFDGERDGFVLGEGAGMLVLEELDHARARGARILAELVGYGATADAFHVTAPSEGGIGARRAMELALREAGLSPDDVDYVNAHGTSTPLNDRAETRALKDLFGARAHRVPVSSTKSMTGHLLGAAGAVEAIVCVQAIRQGVVPPTINQETPDPECDLDYVPNQARAARVRVALSTSLGFGGHTAGLDLRAWPA
jgi:3-oxoacyl-[acyl-carrier-protein] synthase II